MTDRVVSYAFRANFAQFTAGLTAMGRGVNDVGIKLTALDRNGAKLRQGLDTLGRGAGKVGLVAAAGLGAAILASANFEQAMSRIDAATHETAQNMDLLRKAAIDAGAKTVFSASEAADAITALAKAGVSTKDILGGALNASLALASAGELDVAQAADIAATALNQFGLGGDSASHVADLLAAGAGKAQGEVTDMAAALKYVGPVAHQMGVSIEETAGTIAELASQGIIGEQAGTSLRGMLTSLTSPSKIAADQMKALGVNLYDASGQFVGLDGVAGQLKTTMGALSNEERDQALGRIFGNEQITAARILYAGGAEAVKEWTKAVSDDGYAADTAARKLDNLKGDLEQLKGSLETALIGAGDGSQGPLRKLTQGTTDVVNGLNAIPGPLKNVATGMLAITAITGGGLWFGSKVVGGIAATKAALANLGLQAGTTRAALSSLGAVGVGLTAVFGEASDILSAFDTQSRSKDAAAASVKSFQDLSDALSKSNVGKYADDLGVDIGRLSQELLDSGASGEYVQKVLADLQGAQEGFSANLKSAVGNPLPFYTSEQSKAKAAQQDLNNVIGQSGDILGLTARQTNEAANSTATYGKTMVTTANAVGLTAKELAGLTNAMRDQRKAALEGFDAETQYRSALVAAQEQGDKSNAGIKGSSEEALANRDAISSLAAAWNNQTEAVKNNKAKFAEARKSFIDSATAMGVPIKQAHALARRLLEIPSKVVINTEFSDDIARGQIRSFSAFMDSMLHPRNVHVGAYGNGLGVLQVTRNNDGSIDHDSNPATGNGRARGGMIYGPGTATSDSIPAMLSDGEFVVQAAAVAKYGVGFFAAANQMRLAGGGSPSGLGSYIRNDLDLKFPSTLKQWNAALAASTKAIDKERSQRDDLISKRADLSSQVSGNFQSDIFGDKPTNWAYMSEADRQRYLTQNPVDVLNKDAADASTFEGLLKQLAGKGLDGAAFGALASTGDIQRAQAFAGQTPAQLAAFEKAFDLRNRASALVGNYAGATVYNKQIDATNGHLKYMQQQNRELAQKVDHLEKAVRHAGRDVKNGVNGANSHRAGQLRVAVP